MVAKKGKKAGRKVRSLRPKPLSARKATGVKAGSIQSSGGNVPHNYNKW